jgi:mono/diheme cytochrome c family protein
MLTPDEQQRVTAGQQVYIARCQTCHLPNGQGQPTIATPLDGAANVVGPSSRLVRILLHGKDGAVGLMPPFGAVLDEEQAAAVLSYVRRAWSNVASPIDPAFVGQVRAATTGRSRPWTDAELSAIPEGQ